MENRCKCCGSYAINQHLHGRVQGKHPELCDVCYWREEANDFMGLLGHYPNTCKKCGWWLGLLAQSECSNCEQLTGLRATIRNLHSGIDAAYTWLVDRRSPDHYQVLRARKVLERIDAREVDDG